MSRKKKYRIGLIGALVINLFAIAFVYIWMIDSKIPNELMIQVGEAERLDFNAPLKGIIKGDSVSVFSSENYQSETQDIHFDFGTPFTLTASEKGSYHMKLSLFGLIHLKDMTLDVVDELDVIPGGENIGIYVETNGIMVLGTGSVTGIDGMKYEPAKNIIKSGDYILAINGEEVSKIKEMSELIDANGKKMVDLKISREGVLQTLRIKPVQVEKEGYRLGIWVREDTQGIGTLTYRTEDGKFGALGHGITDSDTGFMIEMNKGTIYDTEIVNLVKGSQGKPGEIVGIIRNSDKMKLGDLKQNTVCGIFGEVNKESTLWEDKEEIPIGFKQEIETGPATILCQLGDEVEEYDIEIEKVKWNSEMDSKGMAIRITDPRLLKKTNGIIQGMSGSPIIQNNKIIGAVTYVFIQDSTKGYGIFIENMLKK